MQKINVDEQINLLIKLQALDSELYHLRRERETKPRLIEELEALKNQEQAKVKNFDDKIKALHVKRKEKEIDLQEKEENVKKLQLQLYQIKTNKEYQTMQHEIDGVKADNSRLEDEILVMMEEADNLTKELAKEKQLYAEAEKRLSEEGKKIEQEIATIENAIVNLQAKRQEIATGVDKGILAKYEKVLVNRDGLALVPIKNHACQGCFINLPPQVINEVRMKDKVTICENCARMLYIESEADA